MFFQNIFKYQNQLRSTQKGSPEKVNNSVLYEKATVSLILIRARHLCPC